MKQNKYDDPHFFSAYENMPRSAKGLEAAGEWYALKEMLPDLEDKHVLDLGCGFGWHCRYVRENGAASVTGVDISNKMLEKANRMTEDNAITYIKLPIEEIDFEVEQFDLVFSSLAFHYIQNFDSLCEKVYKYLAPKGNFVFSVEHPIFTARSEQDWYYDMEENPLHWPLDHYHSEGERNTTFLTENVVKYHRTLATYINTLIHSGFSIKEIKESKPSEQMLVKDPTLVNELRRPMFLMIAAEK